MKQSHQWDWSAEHDLTTSEAGEGSSQLHKEEGLSFVYQDHRLSWSEEVPTEFAILTFHPPQGRI